LSAKVLAGGRIKFDLVISLPVKGEPFRTSKGTTNFLVDKECSMNLETSEKFTYTRR
jgi:hypothetical protein